MCELPERRDSLTLCWFVRQQQEVAKNLRVRSCVLWTWLGVKEITFPSLAILDSHNTVEADLSLAMEVYMRTDFLFFFFLSFPSQSWWTWQTDRHFKRLRFDGLCPFFTIVNCVCLNTQKSETFIFIFLVVIIIFCRCCRLILRHVVVQLSSPLIPYVICWSADSSFIGNSWSGTRRWPC